MTTKKGLFALGERKKEQRKSLATNLKGKKMPQKVFLSSLLSAFLSVDFVLGYMDLYIDADQTERLSGIKTINGIYYIKDGVVNQYAMNFQDQV